MPDSDNLHPSKETLSAFLNDAIQDDGQRAALEEHINSCNVCDGHMRELLEDSLQGQIKDAGELIERDSKRTQKYETTDFAPGAKTQNLKTDAPTVLANHPDYEIREKLGEGGMGVVFKAYQPNLKRTVVIKTLLAGFRSAEEYQARFRTEAEAAARLQHANIVQIHDVGEQDGQPYMVLEFIDGPNLAEVVDGTPQAPEEAARLIETLARAIHHAHEHGIVHRDLKPANILLASGAASAPREHKEHRERREMLAGTRGADATPLAGTRGADATPLAGTRGADATPLAGVIPKIADFGLAKLNDSDALQTQTGRIMGTPSYMAPEQATGDTHHVGPAADIYALGAILYDLLTGRPPFKAATIMETIRQVSEQEPVPPRQLQQKIHRDLETIVLKCLRKEPEKRYASAYELAEDLRCYQEGLPIRARPIGAIARAWRWRKRNPIVAALLVLVCALIIAVMATSVLIAVSANWAAVKEREFAQKQGEAAAKEREAANKERKLKKKAEDARLLMERTLIDARTAAGLTASTQERNEQAVLWFADAVDRASEFPEREHANRLRVHAWRNSVCETVRAFMHPADISYLRFDPSGRFLVAHLVDDRVYVWDVQGEKLLFKSAPAKPVYHAAWSSHGVLALAKDNMIELREMPPAKVTRSIPFPERVLTAAFSRDGSLLAVAGRAARIWDMTTNKFITPPIAHPDDVYHLAFSERGDRLLTACFDRRARVYSVAEQPKLLFPPLPHNARNREGLLIRQGPQFVYADQRIVTESNNSTMTVWDARTGVLISNMELGADISSVAFDPNGRYAASSSFSRSRIWDLVSGKSVGNFIRHGNFVGDSAISSSHDLLLTVCGDRSARLWTVPGGMPYAFPMLLDQLVACAFHPSGACFATAQDSGLVRVWRLPKPPSGNYDVFFPSHKTFFTTWKNRLFAPIGTHRQENHLSATQVFGIANGKKAGPVLAVSGSLTNGAFAPEKQRLLTLSRSPHEAILWNWQTGNRLQRQSLPSQPLGGAFSPDGKTLVISLENGDVLLADADTLEVRKTLRHRGPPQLYMFLPSRWIAFSPGGEKFVTWGLGNTAIMWETATGKKRHTFTHGNLCFYAEFSQDGKLLATCSRDKTARIWDTATGKLARDGKNEIKPITHPDWVFTARFSPDGRYLLTSCRDRMARLLDWRTGKRACPALGHDNEVFDAAFTPDGKWMITVGRDEAARIWQAPSGKLITPSKKLGLWGYQVETVSTGKTTLALVAGSTHLPDCIPIHVFDLNELYRPPFADSTGKDVLQLAELVSDQTIDPGGGAVNLTAQEWMQRWRTLRAKYPAWHKLPPATPGTTQIYSDAAKQYVVGKYRNLAIGYGKKKQDDAAAYAWSKVIELDPKDDAAWYGRGRAYYFLRRHPEAARDFAQAVKLKPDHWLYLRYRGQALNQMYRGREALADFSAAMKLRPSDPYLLNSRGVAHFRMREFDLAITDFTEALKLRPNEALFFRNRGINHAEKQDWKNAVADFRKSQKIQPDYAPGYTYLMTAYLALDDRKAYAAVCREIQQRFGNTKSASRQRWLAWYGSFAGGIEDKILLLKWAKAAADSEPQNPYYLGVYGAVLHRAGRHSDAIRHMSNAARQMSRPDVFTMLHLSMAFTKLNRRANAAHWLNKAQKHISQFPSGTWYNRVQQGLLLREAKTILAAGGLKTLETKVIKAKLTAKSPADDGRHFSVHVLKMNPKFAYWIDLESKQFDTILLIQDAKKNEIAKDDDGGDGLNSRYLFQPKIEQDFRIIATTYRRGDTGEYTLTIRKVQSGSSN